MMESISGPKVITRIEPCSACLRDPAFGIVHSGCGKCVREYRAGSKQPPLVRVSDRPVVYAERRE
jgi:hypothetical protein